MTFLFFEGTGCLQRLGRVLNVTPSRSLVVKTEKTPRIGFVVIDENLKAVGKVFDIIGPVSSPYAVVRPTVKEPEKLVSRLLYVVPSEKRSKRA
jgi:RNA-binding protein